MKKVYKQERGKERNKQGMRNLGLVILAVIALIAVGA
jgi:hypothetical protein